AAGRRFRPEPRGAGRGWPPGGGRRVLHDRGRPRAGRGDPIDQGVAVLAFAGGDGAHDPVRRPDPRRQHGWQAAVQRSMVHRHGPDARDRRGGGPAAVAHRGAGARRRPAERPTIDAGGPDPRDRSDGPDAGGRGVPRELSAFGGTMSDDLDRIARAIIDGNRYLVLGTSDPSGRPWVSPVYYAPSGYAELYWVSSPEARHSRNLAARPELSIVVFDSQTPVGEGQGVYMSALGEELTGVEVERGIEIFSRVSVSHGAKPWTLEDVQDPAVLRLYQARVSKHWVLDPERRPDQRTRVQP